MPLTLKGKSVPAEPIRQNIFSATPMRAAAVWAIRTSSQRWFVRVLTSLLGSRAWGLNLIQRFMKPTPGVYPRAHRTIQARSGMAYSRALMRRAHKLGVEVRYRQRVEALVMHNGRVLGVELTDMDADSPEHKTLMAKSVVTCLRRFRRQSPDACSVGTMDFHGFGGLHTARGRIEEDPATGDGIRMAEAVGAGLVGMEYVLAIPFWGGRVLDYPGAEIFLTARGERFTDETASWDTVLADLTAAGGSEFWVITDSRSRKGATFATKVQQGLVESAASLKELAKR